MTMPHKILSWVVTVTLVMTFFVAAAAATENELSSSSSRELQQTGYRVVFESFVLQFVSTNSTTTCSSTMAQSIRDGFEDCLRVYSRDRCNIDASYIGLGGATCASNASVTINGGVYSFNGMDALPATIQNCVKEASYSETCLTTIQAALPEIGSIEYGEDESSSSMPSAGSIIESPSPSDMPSSIPSNTPVLVVMPSMSPSERVSLSASAEPTTSSGGSLAPSLAPTVLASDPASQVPSLLELPAPPTRVDNRTRVPTSTSAIVNEPLPKSQKSKTIPITTSTVGVALAAVLLLLLFVVKKRDRQNSDRKAPFERMDDDDESNASGLIGIAPMQAINKNGDLEQAVEMSLPPKKKKGANKYEDKESALNRTLSTTATGSPNTSTEILPDVQKKFRNISERSLPRPDLTPRRTPQSMTDRTPFDGDEEVPSNPPQAVTPSPVAVQKEICGTSWWKQMNSSGRKVRNPTFCPYTPMMEDGLCCPQSVPGIILDKSTVRDDVSDFEQDGAWDPDDTSVPSYDNDSEYFQHTSQQQQQQQQKSVVSSSSSTNEILLPSVVTPPNAKSNSHFSGMLPPLRRKSDSDSKRSSSNRPQVGFQMDRIVIGSEKEV